MTLQGAAAILEYNAIESPLAQPRNAVLGHMISALVGVAIAKLFELHPHFESIRWAAGAMACGLASATMTLTKTVHPPAGATALLAAVDPTILRLGWYLLPLVLLSATLTILSAMLINNVQRQFPLYWLTPVDLSKGTNDIEKTSSAGQMPADGPLTLAEGGETTPRIIMTPGHIWVPEHFYLAAEERAILEILRNRLREGLSSRELERLPSMNPSKRSQKTDSTDTTR